VSAGTVGVNRRGSARPDRGVPVGEFTRLLLDEVDERALPEDTDDAVAG
jgi:hypothetical protein